MAVPTFGVFTSFSYPSEHIGWRVLGQLTALQKLSIGLQEAHGEMTVNGLYEISSERGMGMVESWKCLLQGPHRSSAALDQALFGFASISHLLS